MFKTYQEINHSWSVITECAVYQLKHARNARVVLMDMFSIAAAANRFCYETFNTLQWRHNGRDSVNNHQPDDCLLISLFRRRSKKTSKLRVTGLCTGNSPEKGEFPAQVDSNAESVSIWWRHHDAGQSYSGTSLMTLVESNQMKKKFVISACRNS